MISIRKLKKTIRGLHYSKFLTYYYQIGKEGIRENDLNQKHSDELI